MDSKSASDSILSSSFELGIHSLLNRIVIAPMSCLSNCYNLSQSGITEYYAKKAGAGLIITDPTLITPLKEFNNCPGIYSRKQIEKWREITKAVRDRNGKIFLQLWYCEDESLFCQLEESIYINGLGIDRDPSSVVRLFRYAAQNALAADFDGIEIQATFGYVNEFDFKPSLRFSHNIEQQLELLSLTIEEVASVWNENRVGIRITPELVTSNFRQVELYHYLYQLFGLFDFYRVGYVHLVQSTNTKNNEQQIFSALTSILRPMYDGAIISSCYNSLETAKKIITSGNIDLVSFDNSVVFDRYLLGL